jgi:hypothetical protein
MGMLSRRRERRARATGNHIRESAAALTESALAAVAHQTETPRVLVSCGKCTWGRTAFAGQEDEALRLHMDLFHGDLVREHLAVLLAAIHHTLDIGTNAALPTSIVDPFKQIRHDLRPLDGKARSYKEALRQWEGR